MKAISYNSTNEAIITAVTGRVITYLNDTESSVKKDGVRRLLIKSVDNVAFGKSGKRYLTAKVIDLDDNGEEKFRSLHVAGIKKIDGKLKTAFSQAKMVLTS